MKCGPCRMVIEDEQGAIPFKVGGEIRFWMHPSCANTLVEGGVAVGQVVRNVVEMRKPGFFNQPLIRSAIAAIKELRKAP